ncbi:MAG: Tat pathway signal sequence domain protein [Bryobacteraceae bacterium]
MKTSRREILELLAAGAAAAYEPEKAAAQETAPAASAAVTLDWLGGQAPQIPAGVSWGVPFARGTVSKEQNFALTGNDGMSLPLQSWPLAYWPDGSIKFVGFATVAPANSPGEMRLAPGSAAPVGPAVRVEQRADAIEVDTGAIQCSIPRRGPDFIGSLRMDGREIVRQGRLVCRAEDRGKLASSNAAGLDEYVSDIRNTVVEQSGPVRAVVRIEGVHKASSGNREWLPFTLRLYFHGGLEHVRLVHTFIFDGDQETDFIRGIGVSFAVAMREEAHNRHVRFSGDGPGVWGEPLQPATGRAPLFAPGTRTNLYTSQLAGQRLPNKDAFDARGQKLLTDWAVWDAYKLVQPTADGFTIQKRTNPRSCWLDAGWGRRTTGVVFVGDVSGGLGAGLRNMWQSYPASFEIEDAASAAAGLRIWFWPPDAPAMDLRHYDTKAHGLMSSYEDVQPGFSTAHGVARTSEAMLFPGAAVPSHEETARRAKLTQEPPLLVASPAYLHSTKVFGIWSLPDRSVAAKAAVEDRLDAAFALYRREVEQRHWYGFWNYGDVMHQHDGPRHAWRYDVGGFAWDNTELGTGVWLWYTFLRTGRVEVFRMAEAMTRHTSEVDVYHLGRFAGLGSRHNVRHWGCGAKEARISQAAYRRFFYYLTTDERTGDLMRAVVDADYKLLELDPMRLASPETAPIPYPARVRGGPDWLAFCGNWMTEWERTGGAKYRDKIVTGMDCIAKLPYGFLSGPNQLYGYDPKTGKIGAIVEDGFGSYNLATIMGGAEVLFELNELLDHPAWRKVWLQYCRLLGAPKSVVARDNETGTEGEDARYATFGRLAAYVYRNTKNPAFAKRAWSRLRLPAHTVTHVEGPAVLEPLDEVTGISTNSTAQGCLEAIEILEMCGDRIG